MHHPFEEFFFAFNFDKLIELIFSLSLYLYLYLSSKVHYKALVVDENIMVKYLVYSARKYRMPKAITYS